MKTNRFILLLILLAGLIPAQTIKAQTVLTWAATAGDFYTGANWDTAAVPGVTDIATINNGGTATIAANAGDRELGSVRLGETQDSAESGHVVMNGGFLKIGSTSGDPKALIGNSGTLSTFIMNGGTIWFDGPETLPGDTNGKGVNELDWEVGERGMGRFEMHNDAVFRASDDLKIAENAAGSGSCVIDGNARVSVGSGVSISSGGTTEQTMVIGGSAIVDSGNSMGAGSPEGMTDEGYLTMAIGGGSARLTIQDNGVLNARRLSARQGTSFITIKNHGQFHIFDVLTGKGDTAANRPPEMGPGADNNNSTYPSQPSEATLTLQDDAQMTVNSAPPAGAVQGIAISGPRGDNDPGGTGRLIILDRASFRVEQDLCLGTGRSADSSDGTLEIVGPAAAVSIGANLNMAVDADGAISARDLDGNPNSVPGKATLSAVITGATHTTVAVTGTARIGQGILKVKLEGFQPAGGTVYTLIQGGAIEGEFLQTDFTQATLPSNLNWKVQYDADAVRLKVVGQPAAPEDSGATPKTTTFYINTPDTLNNTKTESLGVAIASDGNVIVGWEDDGADLSDLEAVWTMFDSNGTSITPNTQITSIDPDFAGQTLTSKFLSYFRSDGSAISGRTSWGPKIHANPFGDGVGMGATSFDLGKEIPELEDINVDVGGRGDFPTVQLLSNTGQAVRIVTIADADAEPAGDIRIADWDYLANGNIVIAGESRQRDDMVDRFGGDTALRHAAYRVVNSSGAEVKAWSLVSSTNVDVEMWHGAASTMNGFALRFPVAGRTQIRLFDNSGNPVSENIDVGTVAGDAAAAGGGRGDGTGFHGNGNDAYVLVNGSGTQVRLTVLKADGTLRYSRSAMDDLSITKIDRTDAAITPTGEVLVVASVIYDGGPVTTDTGAGVSVVLGRLFDASGNPKGATFYVSEKEVPSSNPLLARNPRVAWRGNTAAIVWESQNSGQLVNDTPVRVVAARFFTPAVTVPPTELRITSVTRQANDLSLAWTGGRAPYTVQRKAQLTDAEWVDVATTSETSATVAIDSPQAFIRVVSRVTFAVALSGAAERPNPVTSAGTGSGTLILDGRKLTVDITYSGLTGNVSAGHIHGPATTEQSIGVLQGLLPALGATGATSGTIKGELTVNTATANHMINGMTYVNIHTSFSSSGEIRGQAVPQP